MNKSSNDKNKVKVLLTDGIVLKPSHTTVLPVDLKGVKDGQLYVTHANPSLAIMQNIAIIQAVIATKNTSLTISNFGDKPVALKAGQTLTTATPLEDGTQDASNSMKTANNPDNKLFRRY